MLKKDERCDMVYEKQESSIPSGGNTAADSHHGGRRRGHRKHGDRGNGILGHLHVRKCGGWVEDSVSVTGTDDAFTTETFSDPGGTGTIDSAPTTDILADYVYRDIYDSDISHLHSNTTRTVKLADNTECGCYDAIGAWYHSK